MFQPDALKGDEPWPWSPGRGVDVWAMLMAARNGDLDEIKRLLATDPSLIRCHYEYRTPLSFAIQNNRLDVAEYLLNVGADNLGFGNPIEIAAQTNHSEMKALIARKMKERFGVFEKGEPVARAIRDYDVDLVKKLIEEDPSLLNAGGLNSAQPIHWATMTRQVELIDWLLDRGADINAKRMNGARPIHLTNGDYSYRGWRDVPEKATASPDEVFRHLVSRGAYIDVYMAAAKGDIDRVRELIDEDPSLVNSNNEYNSYYQGCGSALKNAAASGNIDVVQLLLDRGADPNLPLEHTAPNGWALYSAVFNGHYDVAKLLLQHGANPDCPVESSADAVWIAIRDDNRQMLELLASAGASWTIPIELERNITYDDIKKMGIPRSLDVMAYHGDVQGVKELLERDPSKANDPRALEIAAEKKHTEIVELILRANPDVVRHAMLSKPREMAEMLFERGMDANRLDWVGRTPMHHFAGKGDIESATLYLHHGAKLDIRDDEQHLTPFEVAKNAGKSEMVEFLASHGG